MGGGSTSLKVVRVSYMDAHLSACGWRNKHNEACWCCCPASLACSMPLLLPTSLAKRQIYDRVFANVPVGATLFGHVWNFELHDRKKVDDSILIPLPPFMFVKLTILRRENTVLCSFTFSECMATKNFAPVTLLWQHPSLPWYRSSNSGYARS